MNENNLKVILIREDITIICIIKLGKFYMGK